MTMFAIFAFICMLMVAGIGIDLMRYERDRAKLQNTLDRAVLAAADLDQTTDATTVVNDYFTKAGIGQYLTSVTVNEGIGFRTVSANAKSTLNTFFLSLVGIDELSAPAAGTAEEAVGSVEISLVLDVSGSMGSNSRLTRLKPAAKEFIDTVLSTSQEDNVSVSIIPYSTQVSAGASLLSKYTVTDEHAYSNCVNFTSSDFDTTALSTVDTLQRTGHFDVWNEYEDPVDGIRQPVCLTDSYAQILPLSSDQTVLNNYIDALQAEGNTSIDIGMKWGSALLDPSTQGVVDSLINDGEINDGFSGRPTAFRDGSTLKILVLMTDGQNTAQYMLRDDLRAGDSDVYYNAEADRYSVEYVSGSTTQYWWPHDDDWHDHPYGEGIYEACESVWVSTGYTYRRGRYRETGYYQTECSEQQEAGTSVRLSYPELWNQASLQWNADNNYSYSYNRWNDWYYDAYTYNGSSTKDTRTHNICAAAKTAGIIVFTVGFEAPSSGQAVLADCASSDSHHFDVDGLEISDAFESIAASISKLRLVQ
ncbi:VWA domain-containing protein [Thalassovita gelatinovora]|nr:VWA domain-containing protein [Thalassovita gelatinovora]